jgi:nitroreductase
MSLSANQLLTTRASTPSKWLRDPGPNPDELRALLEIAARVPDHGGLVPFRFIVIDRAAGAPLGAACRARLLQRDPDTDDAKQAKETGRFVRSPLCVAVIAVIKPGKIPEVEQRATAACAAFNLLHAAHAHGFGAQWLTGWPAYDRVIATELALADNEHVTGFVYLGSPGDEPAPERPRPSVEGLLSHYRASCFELSE